MTSALARTYLARTGTVPHTAPPSLAKRAQDAAARVEAIWAQFKATGDLRGIHARYRQYRRDCLARGIRAQRFAWYEAEAKRQMVKAIADHEKISSKTIFEIKGLFMRDTMPHLQPPANRRLLARDTATATR